MSLSNKEAAQNLSEVESAERRSREIYHYSKASPHLVMWGVIWIVGYTLTDFFGQYWKPLWAILILVGCAIGVAINRRCARTMGGPQPWRMFALAAVGFVFVFATYAVMNPTHGSQLAAFPAILTGAVYMAVGLWFGVRYVISGIAVIVLTLGGFYYLHEHMLLWMAFVGGGAMVMAGVWFRTV